MKLGELKAVIRKTKGNPQMEVFLGGHLITVGLMKTPLLEALDGAFPGGKSSETGITFDADTGMIFDEGGTIAATTRDSAAAQPATGTMLLADDEPAPAAPPITGLLV